MESAVAAPQATCGGEPIIADSVEAAAAYLFYLCKHHPFVDGNKRVALASCLTFLSCNELLKVGPLDLELWEKFTLDVAASKLDRQGTAEILKALLGGGK